MQKKLKKLLTALWCGILLATIIYFAVTLYQAFFISKHPLDALAEMKWYASEQEQLVDTIIKILAIDFSVVGAYWITARLFRWCKSER